MRIAIDVTPIKEIGSLHQVRGSGEYIENLIKSLKEADSVNDYIYFRRDLKPTGKIDLIHIPYFDPFFFTLPLKFSIPTVVTIHDMIPFVFPNNFPSGIKGKLIWQSQKVLLKKVKGIITDSVSSKNDIMKFLPFKKDRIHVIYLAAGEQYKILKKNQLSNNILQKYNLPKQFLLYVGDATWNKNLPRLIEAVKKTNFPLVIVGKAFSREEISDNPWNNDLRNVLEETKNVGKFHLLGYVPADDLVELYNLAALFVFPSLYEGFGLPVLEAMSSGCPVLTSKKGSLDEIAGDAACFIDPYNTDDIRKNIIELLTNEKERDELSKKGVLQSSKFSWKNTAKNTLQVYQQVMNIK